MKRRVGAGKSYADILTILLVIIIIAIISLLGFFSYKIINKKTTESNAADAYDEFLAAAKENKKLKKKTQVDDGDVEIPTEVDKSSIYGIINNNNNGETSTTPEEEQQTGETTTSQQQTSAQIKKTYLGNYEIKGSINIPKTGCKYVILERVTVDSLKKSVAIMEIAANPELNTTVKDLNVPGTNAFILGHNYMNGQFFSDNDKLSIGDKIKITDQYNTEVTYTIYDMFYTTPDDASFMTRTVDLDTREITLQTCNENSSKRLIILARDK